ncbi:MAG TPA: hypothetical protein VHX68_00265 [Planctomycetaceae bacterium]|nr:hypothetical protein [Planctomycetaceae bacterium]
MYLRYGNYIHANNEVGFTITRDAKRSQGETFYAYQEKWSCKGDLLNYASQGAISNAIERITAAYSIDGQDLVFLLDDGVTPSAHQLLSANCNGGTRVVKAPSFPDTYGAGEYQPVYGRSYTFEIEGETQLTNENVFLTFTESVSFKGTGGPIVVYQQVAQGPWIPQQTSETSLYHATQKGSAVGLYAWPSIPAPLFPDALINQDVDAGLDSPRRFNRYEYPVSWSYTYQSNTPLAAFPDIATS